MGSPDDGGGATGALKAAEKARLQRLTAERGKLQRLTEALRAEQAKCFEITEEINRLLNGEAGIGDKLKAVEAAFSLAWSERYAPGNLKAYQWRFAQDRAQIKRLLKAFTVEELTRRIGEYFRDPFPFYRETRHQFGTFVSGVNRYAVDHGGPIEDLALESPAPGDCTHAPACRSDQEHTKRRMAEHRA